MLFKILDFLRLKVEFTGLDTMYKNLKLKDYGLNTEEYDLLSDDNLKDIFIYEDKIPFDIYKKFVGKYQWSLVLKWYKIYVESIIFTILYGVFFILTSLNIFTISFLGIMVGMVFYFNYKMKKNIKSYFIGQSLLQWQEELKKENLK